MSKRVNPTAIGLFIVIGLALGASGLLLFSSPKLFSHTLESLIYFNDSLNGLDEGAPVKYRGVTIGSVKRVMVRFNQATNDYAMPVIIELDPKLIKDRLGESAGVFTEAVLTDRVQHGMRASLQPVSLVTGVLYIDLRPNPNAPPPVFHQLQEHYPEIPSESTEIQQLFDKLASLDIKSLETNLNGLIRKLDVVISSVQVGEIQKGITNVLSSIDRLVSSPEITNDLVALHATLDQYRLLAEKLNVRVDPLADSLTNVLAQASGTLQQFRGAGEHLRTILAPDSSVRNELELALQQLGGAAQSTSSLAEFLSRHPNALIVGRENPPRKP
jgi:paraquat-inducible protein B